MTETKLRDLIEKWRRQSAVVAGYHATMGTGWAVCADELEAALADHGRPETTPAEPDRTDLLTKAAMMGWENVHALGWALSAFDAAYHRPVRKDDCDHPDCVALRAAIAARVQTRYGGSCGTTPFYLMPGQVEPEYDQGHSVIVWYDDLYTLAERTVSPPAAAAPPAERCQARTKKMSGEYVQCALERGHDLHQVEPPVAAAVPEGPQDDDLHTGDDERLDCVTNIRCAFEQMRDDREVGHDCSEVDEAIPGILEDLEKLDALLLATIKRERAVRPPVADSVRPEGAPDHD